MRNSPTGARALLSGLLVSALACLAPAATAQDVAADPLPHELVRAFPKLRLRRPIVVTHAGDQTDRLFVLQQYGSILVMPNDPQVEEPRTFLDIESRVVYNDKQNEEGLLGLAFHPNYRENGYFYLYYTTTDAPHTSVVSRFKVSAEDPNRADPNSELELLRIKQPFWNHNGGGLLFGGDGYLYIALGDGGKANDPQGNGQNLATLLGSILRIDVDRKADGRNYAIPADNPFVNRKGARGEIYAYGFRNVWGMSYDARTGLLWAADVGQDLWEEIDLVKAGGNYGWNNREALHAFQGREPIAGTIDPIWEYHHSVGKSITGGHVYYGKRLPRLQGHYVYADYLSGHIWALKYDAKAGRTTANHLLVHSQKPIMGIGTDSKGELLFTDAFGFIYQLQPAK